MPIPKPKDDEKQDEFIGRCMSELKEDYEDEKQRLAVCFSAWKKDKEEDSAPYQCECIECGHTFESDEHCRDIKCPECGGTCRRAERPGPGQNSNEQKVERRAFPMVEVRVNEDGKKITGHAAVFNKLSEDLGGFREKVAAGAFTETIGNDDIRALFNHDPNYVLGRTTSGTLAMREDSKGLAIEVDTPDTTWAKDLKESIKRGDVNQMSFAFIPQEEEWDEKKKERTLNKVKLFDVSVVTYPAYPQTSVKVRSLIEKIGEDKAIEILEHNLPAPAEGTEAPLETSQEAQVETQWKLNNLKRKADNKNLEV